MFFFFQATFFLIFMFQDVFVSWVIGRETPPPPSQKQKKKKINMKKEKKISGKMFFFLFGTIGCLEYSDLSLFVQEFFGRLVEIALNCDKGL